MDNNNNFNQNFENQSPVEPQVSYQEAPQNNVPQPQPVYTPPVNNSVPQGDVPPTPALEAKKETNGMAIGSLITGILSVTCCCGTPLAFILGIVAIALGVVSKKQKPDNNGMAMTGIIIGAIAIVLGIIGTIIILSAGLIGGITEAVNASSYSYYY